MIFSAPLNFIVNFCNNLSKKSKVFKNCADIYDVSLNKHEFHKFLEFRKEYTVCMECGRVVIVLETKSNCSHYGLRNKLKLLF